MEKRKRNSKDAAGHFLMLLKEIDRSIEIWIRNFIEEIEKQKTKNVNQ